MVRDLFYPMRWIWMPVGLLLLMIQPLQAGHKPVPKIFLRVNIQTAGQGLPDSQASEISLPPNGETILIRTLPEVTEHELIGVAKDASGAVHLLFNHVGEVNLSAATGQNQGRILVVFIDGVIVYAPIIDEQITTGELVLPHPLTPQIEQLLQEVAKENVKQAGRT